MMDHGVIRFAECRLAHYPLMFVWVMLSHPNNDSCHPLVLKISQWLQESSACKYTKPLGFCWMLLNYNFWLEHDKAGKSQVSLWHLSLVIQLAIWLSRRAGHLQKSDLFLPVFCFFLFPSFWWGKLAVPDLLWRIIYKSSALWPSPLYPLTAWVSNMKMELFATGRKHQYCVLL